MQSSYFRIYIYLFVAFYVTSSFYGCKSDEESDINGYWKVTSIRLPDQASIVVDSQFYAFQKKYVFSFNRLINPDSASISYGYVDYPEKDKIHILIDRNQAKADFPLKSQWQAFEATFTINTLSGNRLILEKGDTLFILKKY
jgi:Lipocalin-like domain